MSYMLSISSFVFFLIEVIFFYNLLSDLYFLMVCPFYSFLPWFAILEPWAKLHLLWVFYLWGKFDGFVNKLFDYVYVVSFIWFILLCVYDFMYNVVYISYHSCLCILQLGLDMHDYDVSTSFNWTCWCYLIASSIKS